MRHIYLIALTILSVGAIQAQTLPTPSQTDKIIIDTGAPGHIHCEVMIRDTIFNNGLWVEAAVIPDNHSNKLPTRMAATLPMALVANLRLQSRWQITT